MQSVREECKKQKYTRHREKETEGLKRKGREQDTDLANIDQYRLRFHFERAKERSPAKHEGVRVKNRRKCAYAYTYMYVHRHDKDILLPLRRAQCCRSDRNEMKSYREEMLSHSSGSIKRSDKGRSGRATRRL